MRIMVIIVVSFAVFACSTQYKPQNFSGGYSSTQLDTNLFQVSFNGNAYISREKANDFALLRSAEISVENGFKYFVLINSKETNEQGAYTTPQTSTTYGTSNTYGDVQGYGNQASFNANTYGSATTTTSGGQTYIFTKPSTTNTVLAFKNKPDGFSYNAEFIIKSLKTKYKIKE